MSPLPPTPPPMCLAGAPILAGVALLLGSTGPLVVPAL